jgi:hypothetical protein
MFIGVVLVPLVLGALYLMEAYFEPVPTSAEPVAGVKVRR